MAIFNLWRRDRSSLLALFSGANFTGAVGKQTSISWNAKMDEELFDRLHGPHLYQQNKTILGFSSGCPGGENVECNTTLVLNPEIRDALFDSADNRLFRRCALIYPAVAKFAFKHRKIYKVHSRVLELITLLINTQ